MSDLDLRELSDELLVDRARGGDRRAFEQLVWRYAGLTRSYARRLTGSAMDADDVVQETFITAWSSLDQLADSAAVKSWLMRITSRKSVDRIRARHPDRALEDWDGAAPTTAEPQHRAELNSQLDAAARVLAELPEIQRQCWALRELGELSYREIAEELDIAEATVRGALARARTALLRGLEQWR